MNYDKDIDMRVWHTGVPRESVFTSLMYTDENGYSVEPKEYPIINGHIQIRLPKTSAIVLKCHQERDEDEIEE